MTGFAERIAKLSPNRLALLAIDLNQKLESMQTGIRESIAIIGIGCRFPGGVKNIDDYWQLLVEGRDAVSEVPNDRWDTNRYYDPDPNAPGRMNTRWGAFLRDVDRFDAEFFGIAPREALNMDPQQRFVLETAWEALENAGQAPHRLEGSKTGVFIGASGNDYLTMLLNRDVEAYDAYVASGGAHSVISGRLSYFLGLQGPSLSIDTACSSSLSAIHLACQSLKNQECRMALAGGVNLVLTPAGTVALSKVNLMAPDGRCKAFDESANGFVRGEGCGIVVLKRLSDAQADGDAVLALIRGSAINQDGRSNGLTAPNGPAQEAVIRAALRNAGLESKDVGYVEAHGTGTSLGDPIEVQALGAVFQEGHTKENPLQIGSVKTNIGHLEAAAGVAGLIKVVLSLQNKTIPPHLHLKKHSSFIPWEELPVEVPLTAVDWNQKRRIAGVSSFGFSGANAHVILAEAPPVEERPADLHDRPLHLCCLSAKNPAVLQDMARRWAEHISNQDPALADLCHTANTGRSHFPYRLCIPADSTKSLLGGLDGFSGAGVPDNCFYKRCDAENPPKIAFLFTGQGAQYPGMGKELFETQPLFRKELERCDALLRPYLDKPLLSVMYPDDPDCAQIHQTQYAQPALFAFEYAMAALWQSWGVKPSAVMGHSIGEYTAACLAGVMTLDDALRLVAERGNLIQSLPLNGAMAAVFASETPIRQTLKKYAGHADIAAINGPESFVISGSQDAVKAIQNELEAQGIKSKNLRVSHAFHSPLMEPILKTFEQIAQVTEFSQPRMDILSNLSGKLAEGGDLIETSYWVQHLRRPVQFRQSIQTLIDDGYRVFVEIGPSPKLTAMAQLFVPDSNRVWLPSIRRGKGNWQQLLESLARLYVEGVEIDWLGFDKPYPRTKTSLPTYPFRKNRYWLETKTQNNPAKGNPCFVDTQIQSVMENSSTSEINDFIYETAVSTHIMPYLIDHRVYGQIILPAPVYLNLILLGLRDVNLHQEFQIGDFVIQEALAVPDEGEIKIQIQYKTNENNQYRFELYSQTEAGDESIQKLHATGYACPTPIQNMNAKTSDVSEIRSRCQTLLSKEDYYSGLLKSGVQFGPAFQGIETVGRRDGEAFGEIRLHESLVEEAEKFPIHPTLLDACFQVMGAALPMQSDSKDEPVPYLMTGLESLTFYGPIKSSMQVHAELFSPDISSTIVKGKIRLLDENGGIAAVIEGLCLKRAERSALLRKVDNPYQDWCYEIKWLPKTVLSSMVERRPADYLPEMKILTGEMKETVGSLIEQHQLRNYKHLVTQLERLSFLYIVEALETRGLRFRMYDRFTTEQKILSLGIANAYHRLFGRLLQVLQEEGILKRTSESWETAKLPPVRRGIQELENSIAQKYSQYEGELSLLRNCGRKLADILSGECDPLQILFPGGSMEEVEKLTQKSPAAKMYNSLVQSMIERIVSTLPKDRTLRVLEIGAGTGGTTSFVLPLLPQERAEYVFTDISQQFLVKAKEKFIAYPFLQYELLDIEKDPSEQGFAPHQFDVIIAFDVLHATTDLRSSLKHTQHLLNQNGVLIALEGTGPQRWVDLTFGLTEGWWRFSDTDLRPSHPLLTGPEWMRLLQETGYTQTFLLPDAKKPNQEYAKQAVIVAQASETVKWADIQSKKKLTHSQNWLIVSEDAEFGIAIQQEIAAGGGKAWMASAVGDETEGRRFDFALNPYRPEEYTRIIEQIQNKFRSSINGIVYAASTEKRGEAIDSPEQLENETHQSCRSVLWILQAMLQTAHGSTPRLWVVTQGAQSTVENGSPLRISNSPLWGLGRTVEMEHPELWGGLIDWQGINAVQAAKRIWSEINGHQEETQIAFCRDQRYAARLMRTRYSMNPPASLPIHNDATYLITGGTGGMGLKTARWMAEQGARNLVLVSRRGASAEIEAELQVIRETGAQVDVIKTDVTSESDVKRLLETMEAIRPPLKGIVHSAGIFDDRVLSRLDWNRFKEVLAPKVKGAWLLHQYTKTWPLDFFVLFSSGASFLGPVGLGNYAAGNAFLDVLAQERQRCGLPAVSINWGPWEKVGMAAAVGELRENQWTQAGFDPMTSQQGLEILSRLLQNSPAQMAILPAKWSKYFERFSGRSLPRFYEMLSRESSVKSKDQSTDMQTFRKQLETFPLTPRWSRLAEHVHDQAAYVLGFPAGYVIEPQQGFFDIGMDSLTSIELKNRLQNSLGKALPSTVIFDYPCIEALTNYLADEVFNWPPKSPKIPVDRASSAGRRVERTDATEEELEALLAAKLGTI